MKSAEQWATEAWAAQGDGLVEFFQKAQAEATADLRAQLAERDAQLAALWKCVEQISLNAPKADKTCVEPGISLLEAAKRQVAEATRQPTQDKGDE